MVIQELQKRMNIPDTVSPKIGKRLCQVIGMGNGSHRLEKFLNTEGFLEKYLNIKSASKSTGKLLKDLEKSLNSTIL